MLRRVLLLVPRRPFFRVNNCRFLSRRKMTDKLIWVDCEMSGLDVNKDLLLEIALVITDSDFKTIDTLEPIQLQASNETLETMSDWCKTHFAANGLTERCRNSTITIEQADDVITEFLVKNKIKNGILAGNSIAGDRQFLNKYCPKFVSHLHYRMLDVSSVKILADLWYKDRTFWNKQTEHRALSDIYQSIEELKYYQDKYFK